MRKLVDLRLRMQMDFFTIQCKYIDIDFSH